MSLQKKESYDLQNFTLHLKNNGKFIESLIVSRSKLSYFFIFLHIGAFQENCILGCLIV